MSKRLVLLVPAVVLVASLASSCSKDPEFPEAPPLSASYTPPPPVTPVATGTTPPPVQATVTPCDAAQTTAFTTMIAARAATEVPGMEQVGGLVCGVAPEGQAAVGTTITLEQGWCYSVLGNSLPNVTELDLALTADIAGVLPLPAPLNTAVQPQVAVDGTTGNTAAITPGNNCLQWTLPVPAVVKLSAKATRGSGAVGAQVYRKKKAW